MANYVVMPKIGLTMTEGTIGTWLKKEGDPVQNGEKLFDVKTDKLTNDVVSEDAGILLRILEPEGAVVACLKPVAIIGAAGEDISSLLGETGCTVVSQPEVPTAEPVQSAAPAAANGRIIASPAAKKLARESGIDLHLVAGHGPNGRIVLADVQKFAAEGGKAAPKSSPMAKKLAAQLDVDLSQISKDSRIMKGDVLRFAAGAAPSSEALEETVPMTTMRSVIAQRMKESVSVSPTVTYTTSVNVAEMARLKQTLKPFRKLTYTDIMVKIVSTALMEFPYLNCSVDGSNYIFKHYVNMGIAVAVDNGLLVPVVKNAHLKGLAEISDTVSDLASRAKNNALTSDDMTGSTFTITNLGMFGIESFSPIINQPEVAILGVNAIRDELYLDSSGAVASRKVMNLSLTADHRAVDGALAAQFLQRVKSLAEAPAQLLL